MGCLDIRELESDQIPIVTDWSRREGFAPGLGDIEIYRHTDRQGLWIAWLDHEPIGCIAGVRYNPDYGFIGLYLVVPPSERSRVWPTALEACSRSPFRSHLHWIGGSACSNLGLCGMGI